MSKAENDALIAWLPDLIYTSGRFEGDRALVCDAAGAIVKIPPVTELREEKRILLTNRALLPGMVNAHSHAFQRVLRGRTEFRANERDSFWTWRELMYSAATRLTPEDIYDASRMAFLEMALSGITAVGEFHYLHHAPDGKPYDDPNLLAKEVIRAAGDVGLRIALLRVAYARSGFNVEPEPKQTRFIEANPRSFLKNLESLIADVNRGGARATAPSATAWVGVAPHSVRAVPLDYLRAVIGYANDHELKVHMHVAEQPAEVSACVEEYGRTPIALLESEGLLSDRFTAVHAIHVTPKAIPSFAKSGAMVCACPTTERNLGDGVVPADEYLKHGVSICLGTDSHAQIDLLEDARELEYHLRLQKLERAILGARTPSSARASDTAAFLFDCATVNGARSIGAPNGSLEIGKPADFFTVDLNDPTIAGASPDDLLASIVFSISRAAVREVVVGGKPIVSEGQHLIQEEAIERFNDLQRRLWV
ncbi:MAG TPA: formimidoylglutamate deiminase [Pyrinomonadaceae bacterium]|jgi:formimidoylglutamate deiminase|nr:formimidoylglutamate deiminase [Pyrinomonadaceae bacterium]